MRITKFVQSCLYVETPECAGLFDPGIMSENALDEATIIRLDDIFITHDHSDHYSVSAIKKLVESFPNVHITAPAGVVAELAKENITATTTPPAKAELFDSPHENGGAVFNTPEEIGVHYLDQLTHPGDCHHFNESKAVLALPVTAPWGSMVAAVDLGLKLKPQFILPVHDWHWSEQARQQSYDRLDGIFADHDITFCKLETGVPVEIDL